MHDRFHAIHAISLKISSFENRFLKYRWTCFFVKISTLPARFFRPRRVHKICWNGGSTSSLVKSKKNIIDGDDTTLRQIITKYSHFPYKSVGCFGLLQANGFFSALLLLLLRSLSLSLLLRSVAGWWFIFFSSFLPAKSCWFIFIIHQHQSTALQNPSYAQRAITTMSVVFVVYIWDFIPFWYGFPSVIHYLKSVLKQLM